MFVLSSLAVMIKHMNKRLFYFLFLLILFAATILRLYKLGQIPVSLYWDEVAMLVDAKSVAATGMDMHSRAWYQLIYPSYGDYKLPVYIWFASFFVKIFGVNGLSLRLVSSLAGLMTVLVSGLLAKKLALLSAVEPKKAQALQLLTMAVVAVSPWSVMFSRTAFEGHLAQALVGLSILCLFLKPKSWDYQILSVLLGVLATYTYFSVRFVWPVVYVAAQLVLLDLPDLQFWKNQQQLKSSVIWVVKQLLIPLVVFVILLLPMMRSDLYQASNQFRLSAKSILNAYDYPVLSNQYRQQAGNKFIDRFVFHRYLLMLRELAKNYSDHLSFNFLFVSGDANLRHGTGEDGLFPLLLILPFLAGWYSSFKSNWRVFSLLLIWWLIALLPASVPETTPHALRSLNALIPLAIIIGWGMLQISDLIFKKFAWEKKVTTLLSLIFLSSLPFIYHYFVVYPKVSAFDWQDGYQQLAKEILKDNSSVRTVWVDPFEDRFYLWLLAFGPYTAQEIQAMPKQGWATKEIDNVVFQPFDWGKLETLDHKLMVVGKTENLNFQLQTASLQPKWIKRITTSDGKTPFEILYFEPD